MAVFLLAFCGLGSWCASWMLLSKRYGVDGSAGARTHALERRLRSAIGVLAQTRLTSSLLNVDACRSLASEIVDYGCGHSLELSLHEAMAALLLVSVLIVLAFGVSSQSPIGVVVAVACICGVVVMRASMKERLRRQQLASSMPGVFRTLATALASGHTLVQAIDYVGAHEKGPAASHFAKTSLRLRCGMSVDEAMELLRNELDAPGVGLMVTALTISQRTGSPLRELFQRSALLVEQQGEFERALMVKTAQVRLSVRVVCLLPPLVVCLLSIISPDYQEGIATAAGFGCLTIATLMDVCALAIIRRIMGAVL